MRAVDIITKKRDGLELSRQELAFFIEGFAGGAIPDYQAAAWAMAVLLKGMNARETADLTMLMAASGDQLDLSSVVKIAVDKHSTGGVGDKTTLIVEPLVAACGVPVGKMSGRGLSYTGGTLDKMESISGFRVELTTAEFLAQLSSIGLVLSGQTADLAPADGKLYALRDVTGTVPSTALIASSVMSKKIAAGAQAIVLDVKVGIGAFMQTLEQALELAELMVDIGRLAGRRTVALISDMNQPLGLAVGNALEVREAIGTLRGAGPADLREHALEIAAQMILLGEGAPDLAAARQLAAAALASGAGLAKFRDLVAAQGGDLRQVDDPARLPQADLQEVVLAPRSGYLAGLHAREVGLTVTALGGGRARKGDRIDMSVGVVLEHKVGDRIETGAPLFSVHANDPEKLSEAVERLLDAHQIVDQPVEPLPLFYRTLQT